MTKNKNFLLGIGINNASRPEILEEIKKWLKDRKGFCQIVTVNPEFLVLAQKNSKFKKVLERAQISIPDGVGIVLAGKILRIPFKERITGISLMKEMVKMASDLGLMVGLVGGKGDVALRTAECLKKIYPNFLFFALEGVKDIKKVTSHEWAKIITITTENKPQMLFVAFGAPWQEFFIDSLKKELDAKRYFSSLSEKKKVPSEARGSYSLNPIIAMGVGGAFDEISGRVKRVPKWLDKLGLKWLWRLIIEPWRLKRQLALMEFVILVFKEFLRGKFLKENS